MSAFIGSARALRDNKTPRKQSRFFIGNLFSRSFLPRNERLNRFPMKNLLCFLGVLLSLSARAEPMKALIIDGQNNHDYKRSEERRVGKECRSRWSPDH